MTVESKPEEQTPPIAEKTKAYVLSSLLIIITFVLVNILGLVLNLMNIFTIVLLFTLFFICTGIVIFYSDRLETVSIEKWGKIFRKYSHLVGGIVMIFFSIISPIQLSWICFSLFVSFSIHEYFYVRRNTSGIYTRTLIMIGRMDRKPNSEISTRPKPFLPTLWILAAISIIGLFGEDITLSALIAFALGDSLSAILGEKFGRHKLFYNKTKSLEGSITFFVVTFIGVYCVFYLAGNIAWIPALIAASVGTLIESLIPTSYWLDDNFVVPVGVGVILYFTRMLW